MVSIILFSNSFNFHLHHSTDVTLIKVISDLHPAKSKVISLFSSFSISQHHLTQLTSPFFFKHSLGHHSLLVFLLLPWQLLLL